jgi:hypothetical protein
VLGTELELKTYEELKTIIIINNSKFLEIKTRYSELTQNNIITAICPFYNGYCHPADIIHVFHGYFDNNINRNIKSFHKKAVKKVKLKINNYI